ncbi:filament-like plant protein 7 [Pyrus x bretschneideri]|uniref:filament-like plant protein 7 n=1 Tax=Pyrus x bretschneideri TaxID=225117 RepID=UPI00202E510B|nr:filament-like plant protein 7 [Pyrus x bretschneideri]XP_048433415.1 filament-like plant protein 7 [Pyrus x bretschneideri]
MDHKAWLWRKKSSEKTILAANKVATPLGRIEEEVQTFSYPAEKGSETERSRKNLNEKLASVLLDCTVKEDPVPEHAKPEEEAIAGDCSEKAGESVLKQELEEPLRQGVSTNERSTHSDDALNECMQQLKFVREEQEQRVHEAVMMTSREYEKAQRKLEEKLRETSEQLTNLVAENTNLNRALRAKDKLIEDLNRHKSQTDAEFSALMVRLDSTEKENAFLRYEFHMLEKELEIRSEEMEYNRRSAAESHKQHLESVRIIAKLEQECQRLHLLMRKRLPGPTALVNMKSEVQMLGRDQTEMRRRKQNPTRDMVVKDANMGSSPEISNKKMSLVIEQLRDLEEENKTLREILTKKNAELLSSRTTYSRTASRLSQAETQLGELSKFQKSMELVPYNDISRYSRFDIGSDDSSSESWASALISELEHFKNERLKSPQECSDISLMDDFVEMEKLAIVSAGKPPNNGHQHCFTGRELVPVEVNSDSDKRKHGASKDSRPENSFDWLQVVLKAMLEQKNVSKRSLDELFEDIKIALGYINPPTDNGPRRSAVSRPNAESDPVDSFGGALSIDTSVEDNGSQRCKDASSMRNKINKQFGWPEDRRDNGVRGASAEQLLCLPLVASSNETNVPLQLNMVQDKLQEENSRLKDELKNMEASLQSATEKNKALVIQLQESQQRIESLMTEVESLKESEGVMVDQIENQKSINEDLDTQLTVAKAKLKQVFQKFSSLEVELEDKHNCCEDLEATCLELQLQLQSAEKETLTHGINQDEKQSPSGWEITTASVKLAECQETILNLGKQIKALTTPREAQRFDKVFSTTSTAANATNSNLNRRSSLLDQMLAEDNPKSPKDNETTDADPQKPSLFQSDSHNALSTPIALVHMPEGHLGSRGKGGNSAVGSLAIVPSKKQGGFGLLRRLLLRRKKGSTKKPQSLAKV